VISRGRRRASLEERAIATIPSSRLQESGLNPCLWFGFKTVSRHCASSPLGMSATTQAQAVAAAVGESAAIAAAAADASDEAASAVAVGAGLIAPSAGLLGRSPVLGSMVAAESAVSVAPASIAAPIVAAAIAPTNGVVVPGETILVAGAGRSAGAGHDVVSQPAGDCSSMDRRVWSYQETEALIRLRADESMKKRFGAMKRNRNLWDDISVKMSELEYTRSGTQCAVRWKNLMSQYKESRTAMLMGADPLSTRSGQRACGFYAELEACVGDPPVFNPTLTVGERVMQSAATSPPLGVDASSVELPRGATETVDAPAVPNPELASVGPVASDADVPARVKGDEGDVETAMVTEPEAGASDGVISPGLANVDNSWRPEPAHELLPSHLAAAAAAAAASTPLTAASPLASEASPRIVGVTPHKSNNGGLFAIVDQLVKDNAQLKEGLLLVRSDVEKQHAILTKMNEMLIQIAAQLGAPATATGTDTSPTSKRLQYVPGGAQFAASDGAPDTDASPTLKRPRFT
jgi:Myb/SANT-like DNA-binding domain